MSKDELKKMTKAQLLEVVIKEIKKGSKDPTGFTTNTKKEEAVF